MVEFGSIFKDEFQDFLTLRETCMSISGYKHYRCYLTSFDAYLSSCNLNEKHITETIINGWTSTISGKSGSKSNEIISIRMFIRYLQSLGVAVYIPVIPKVVDDYIPYIFSDAELDRIFSAADNFAVTRGQPNPYMQIEFPMIIRLLYGCGLRIGETLALQMKDVDLKGGIVTILHAKRGKQRLVPMSATLAEILKQYCYAMGIVGIPVAFLFPGTDPMKPASIRSIRNKFDVLARTLGIAPKERYWHERGPCLHCFRHVFVFKSFSKAEQDGRSIENSVPFLSTYLGHDSLNETEKYLKFSSEIYPRALELFEEYTIDVFPEVDYGQ
jgi:integrase